MYSSCSALLLGLDSAALAVHSAAAAVALGLPVIHAGLVSQGRTGLISLGA